MISFVICSVDPERQKKVVENINSTCGFEPEIFVHDNRTVNWGLCKVYNHYSERATNDIICYLHEDLYFKTPDWGKKIVDFYGENPDAGVVGFLGSQIKTKSPSPVGCDPEFEMGSLMQHSNGRSGDVIKMYTKRAGISDFSRVVQIDGLCIIVPKKVWREHPFDELLFDRFHLYDLDFTVNISQYYKNYICHSILVEHMSEGSHNAEWYYYTKLFQDKWGDKLPMSSIPISPSRLLRTERYTAYKFYKNVLKKGMFEYLDFAEEMYKPYSSIMYDLRLLRYKLKSKKMLRNRSVVTR